MNSIIAQHRTQIRQICEQYKVERLDLFGSAATDQFDPANSDFDFIVRFQNINERGISQRFFQFAEDLEMVLKRPVDLLTDKQFTNPYFAQTVAETREVVYDQRSQEASL